MREAEKRSCRRRFSQRRATAQRIPPYPPRVCANTQHQCVCVCVQHAERAYESVLFVSAFACSYVGFNVNMLSSLCVCACALYSEL